VHALTPSDDTYRRILGLRAVRSYREEPIAPGTAEEILEAGRWTGSSKNTQRWAFVVLEDRESLDRLAEAGRFTGPVREATMAIVIVRLPGGNDFDMGRVAQNLMLAAAARGVASCPITLHHEERARRVLDVPDDHGCRWAVAFGHPDLDRQVEQVRRARRSGMSGRRPLSEQVSRGTFQAPE
jgi:nitroreductase